MFRRLARYELYLCLLFNRGCRFSALRAFFAAVSRLGDGIAWYALMLALPLVHGLHGLAASAHMLAVGGGGMLIYRQIKRRTERPRPFRLSRAIKIGTPPLDKYSFPSGHTLHAVGFTVVAIQYLPLLVWLLVPFGLLVAASRLVLGLHYPTDVVFGALIGFGVALLSFMLLPGLQYYSTARRLHAGTDDF
ncbi:MAG: phosphatase PAP2 family protein [Xanthomonadaceae bacterium]|jgi:undecaprenyl-diphosphatase|nr:MAG: hypothetical protein JM57_01655 [Comamonadaceae bacterium BICA1-1]MBS3959983.1 phosphatase PAP2 family protein [Xanthomonadaceae bacterium]MDO9610417.1 phosphatase PAP2 family protein [Serpentinimonas sp.]